jgi:antitoxin HicB
MKTASSYLKQPYGRVVIPVDRDQFHAEVLEFPGCFAQGKTVSEAYANLEKAARAWIEACLEGGQSVPEPSSTISFSGRVALRLPKSVHRNAARIAERDNTSLNTFLVSAVASRVGAEEFYTILANRLEHQIMEVAQLHRQYFSEVSTKGIEIKPLKLEETVTTTFSKTGRGS